MMGKFISKDNVDALHIVLEKDYIGHMVSKRDICLGLKKAFDKECVSTQSSIRIMTPIVHVEAFTSTVEKILTEKLNENLAVF